MKRDVSQPANKYVQAPAVNYPRFGGKGPKQPDVNATAKPIGQVGDSGRDNAYNTRLTIHVPGAGVDKGKEGKYNEESGRYE